MASNDNQYARMNHVCGITVQSKVCMHETGIFPNGGAHTAIHTHVMRDHGLRTNMFCHANCGHIKQEGIQMMGDTFKPYFDRQHHCVYGNCQYVGNNHTMIKNHYMVAHPAAGAAIQPFCKQDCIFLTKEIPAAIDFSGDV